MIQPKPTYNDTSADITDTLDQLLMDYGGSWQVCEQCASSAMINGHRLCRAEGFRECPAITSVIEIH